MCGIVAIVAADGHSVELETLREMTASLRHRGPDASGTEQPCSQVGLGHRRLSIIDLEQGQQPMLAADGDLCLIFNGEIFNYRELRRELQAEGREFRTASDTEVLLALYELRGEQGLLALRGQYAFAIWDQRAATRRLIAARDPLGIKPLYYSHENGCLLIASEPRALLLHPKAPRKIDPYALHLYLRYRFIPAPRSAWRGIHKLGPGEKLVLEAGQLRRERFWQLRPENVECEDDPQRARQDLSELLNAAVERQRVADVPVGAFLSGGLDSSTMAALLQAHSSQPIRSFTIGFERPEYDESEYAREVAEQIGSQHVCEVMGEGAAADVIGEILAHLDEPFGDPSLVPTWLLCRHAAAHHKVMLSGDGADELFAGYGRTYRALSVLAWPSPLRPFHRPLARLRRPSKDAVRWQGDDPRVDEEYRRLLQDIKTKDARQLYGPRLLPCLEDAASEQDPIRQALDRLRDMPPFSRILLADMTAHLADYHLVKVERASMAHGLEVRVPFLDQELVEKSFAWKPAVRLAGGRSKGLLRDVMASRLPERVMTRPKRGFGPPLSTWFRQGLGTGLSKDLLSGALLDLGFIDREALRSLLEPGARSMKGSRLWRLYVLEHWLRRQTG